MFNYNIDLILTDLLQVFSSPMLGVQEKQKLIMKFFMAVLPFLFEKVPEKVFEASYLMLNSQEMVLLLLSESFIPLDP
jgi:hypothetical protein